MRKLLVTLLAFLVAGSFVFAGTDEDRWEEFKKLFKEKRLMQLGAIRNLLSKSDRPKQQVKIINDALVKIKAVFIANKPILESSGLVSLEDKKLPQDAKVREALAFVIENTCMTSDFLLRFPDFVHNALNKDGDLDAVYRWGLGFVVNLISDTSSELFDDGTKKLINLTLMEMDIVEKSEDYFNRYADVRESQPKQKVGFVDPPADRPKRKPKKKLERGPRLSRSEL